MGGRMIGIENHQNAFCSFGALALPRRSRRDRSNCLRSGKCGAEPVSIDGLRLCLRISTSMPITLPSPIISRIDAESTSEPPCATPVSITRSGRHLPDQFLHGHDIFGQLDDLDAQPARLIHEAELRGELEPQCGNEITPLRRIEVASNLFAIVTKDDPRTRRGKNVFQETTLTSGTGTMKRPPRRRYSAC